MNSPQYLLRPVNPGFIAFSFVLAFLFNLMPWGHMQWIPDLVALVLVFWNIHQPRRVGMVVAFLLGLLMDVHEARLLGEHAMAYTMLSYFAITIHRRVLWFSVLSQALHVLPLLMATAMFFQSRMTMKDPKQAALVYIMPVVMVFIMWDFSSGLVLYWTVFNVLQIGQQYLTNHLRQSKAATELSDGVHGI